MKLELSSLALKKMINSLSDQRQSALLSILTPTQLIKYEKSPKLASSPLNNLSLEHLCAKIHPSYFIETLKLYSDIDRRFYLSSLSEKSQNYLTNYFKDPLQPYTLNPSLQKFTLEMLFTKAFKIDNRPTPLSFLPEEPLLFLANASYDQLKTLCDALGLFDVVAELKKVIRSSTLKNIENSLTPDDLTFIQQIQNYRPNPLFQEIGLNNFAGDHALFKNIIFLRGLNRLSIALANSSDPLIWYILHTFSINEAEQFKSLKFKIKENTTQLSLIEQVIFTWNKKCIHSH